MASLLLFVTVTRLVRAQRLIVRFEAAFGALPCVCGCRHGRGARRASSSALRSAQRLVGWPRLRLLVSAFLSYLLFPARDVVEVAYDVLFSRLLAF